MTFVTPRTPSAPRPTKPVFPAPFPFPVCVGAAVPLPEAVCVGAAVPLPEAVLVEAAELPLALSAIWTAMGVAVSVPEMVPVVDPSAISSTQLAIGTPPLAVAVAKAQASCALVAPPMFAKTSTSVEPSTIVAADEIESELGNMTDATWRKGRSEMKRTNY